MQRWEYLVVLAQSPNLSTWLKGVETKEPVDAPWADAVWMDERADLARAGAEGWELVALVVESAGTKLYLKRPTEG